MNYHSDLFSLPSDARYLNCAYMAPMSNRVATAGREALERLRNPSQLDVSDFFDPAMRVRQLFADLINAADPQRVAIVPAVSYGMAAVARNTKLTRTQQVVIVEEQFPSVVYTWRRACTESGASLRVIVPPSTDGSRAAAWNDALLEAIDRTTAVVVVPELHWTDGVRFDLHAVSARAKAVGARLVVDGTQSIGAKPFDVAQVQPDAVVCAGYKWVTGPYGIGVAYFGEAYDDGVPLEENWIARHGSDNFAGLINYCDTYQPGAIRYDVGERSSFILLPMLEAALTQVLEWGPAAVATHTAALTNDTVPALQALGCRIEDNEWRAGHLLGVRLPPAANPRRFADELAARKISVSLRGNAIRIAPYLYNDANDMRALVTALTDVMR